MTDFLKNAQLPNLFNIRPVKADIFPTRKDGQTDKTKLIVAFRNSAKALKTINSLFAPGRHGGQ